jgi:hypothetical protein
MRLLFALLLAALALGCPPSQGSHTSSGTGAGTCPGTAPTCLTVPICSFDTEKQCNICHCGSPYPDAPGVVNAEGVPTTR